MRSILRETEASRQSVSTLLCQPGSAMVHSDSIKSLWRPLVHVIKTHNQNKGKYLWYTGWAWSSPWKAFQTEPGLLGRSYLLTASHMLRCASRLFPTASSVDSRQGSSAPQFTPCNKSLPGSNGFCFSGWSWIDPLTLSCCLITGIYKQRHVNQQKLSTRILWFSVKGKW